MDETGAELPQASNTELTQVKPEGGLLNRLRRVFGGSPKAQQPTVNITNPTSADANFNAWSKDSPHPADKFIRTQQEATLGNNQTQETNKPSFLQPESPDDLPLTLAQPGETPVTVPETKPITEIPVAPNEQKPPVPVEEPAAA